MPNSTPLRSLSTYRKPIHVGDGVRYEGSVKEAHGQYRVLAVADDGRLTLGRKGRRFLKAVRPESCGYGRDSTCRTCDAQPIWDRAITTETTPASASACIDCARAIDARVTGN